MCMFYFINMPIEMNDSSLKDSRSNEKESFSRKILAIVIEITLNCEFTII